MYVKISFIAGIVFSVPFLFVSFFYLFVIFRFTEGRESMYNPNTKLVEVDRFMIRSGANAFTMSPQKWIETVNTIGIISRPGHKQCAQLNMDG